MRICACTNVCKACKETKATLEIYRLKELLYTIREIAVVDFNSTYERLASKGFDDNFRIPESRFNEILEGL